MPWEPSKKPIELADCKAVKHDWKELMFAPCCDVPDGQYVLRWCRVCGCVQKIMRYDGRERRLAGDFHIPKVLRDPRIQVSD